MPAPGAGRAAGAPAARSWARRRAPSPVPGGPDRAGAWGRGARAPPRGRRPVRAGEARRPGRRACRARRRRRARAAGAVAAGAAARLAAGEGSWRAQAGTGGGAGDSATAGWRNRSSAISTRSPRAGAAWPVIRSPFTRVPVRLPRSSTKTRRSRARSGRAVARRPARRGGRCSPSGRGRRVISSSANGTYNRVPAASSITSLIARPPAYPGPSARAAARRRPRPDQPAGELGAVPLRQHHELVDVVAREREVDPVALVEPDAHDRRRGPPHPAAVDLDLGAGRLALHAQRAERRLEGGVDASHQDPGHRLGIGTVTVRTPGPSSATSCRRASATPSSTAGVTWATPHAVHRDLGARRLGGGSPARPAGARSRRSAGRPRRPPPARGRSAPP